VSVKITIYDNAIPMLDEIASIHLGMAKDVLDQAGAKIRKATREAFASSQSHDWFTKYVNGKRVIYRLPGRKAVFGGRHGMNLEGSPTMGGMINSFLMEDSLTMVVSGMHKRFVAKKWRNGVVQGYERPTSAVEQGTYQILKKLNEGGSYDSLDPMYHKKRRPKTIRSFRNAQYKPRNFIERGRTASMGKVTELMTSKLESMIHRQVNRATVKTQVRAS
jgi:hypothetical protein